MLLERKCNEAGASIIVGWIEPCEISKLLMRSLSSRDFMKEE